MQHVANCEAMTDATGCPGYNVFVLETGEAEGWVAPWWTWLVLGVLALVLLTCCARATMRMAGFLKEDRPAKSVLHTEP